MGPGPRSRQVLEREQVFALNLILRAGDHLLVSSDGLARGHNNPVWREMVGLIGDPRARLARGNSTAAIDVLRQISLAAESRHTGGSYLDDNLSLILLAVG
jgi:hypothetical protein